MVRLVFHGISFRKVKMWQECIECLIAVCSKEETKSNVLHKVCPLEVFQIIEKVAIHLEQKDTSTFCSRNMVRLRMDRKKVLDFTFFANVFKNVKRMQSALPFYQPNEL